MEKYRKDNQGELMEDKPKIIKNPEREISDGEAVFGVLAGAAVLGVAAWGAKKVWEAKGDEIKAKLGEAGSRIIDGCIAKGENALNEALGINGFDKKKESVKTDKTEPQTGFNSRAQTAQSFNGGRYHDGSTSAGYSWETSSEEDNNTNPSFGSEEFFKKAGSDVEKMDQRTKQKVRVEFGNLRSNGFNVDNNPKRIENFPNPIEGVKASDIDTMDDEKIDELFKKVGSDDVVKQQFFAIFLSKLETINNGVLDYNASKEKQNIVVRESLKEFINNREEIYKKARSTTRAETARENLSRMYSRRPQN
jgi:hypothetical protein